MLKQKKNLKNPRTLHINMFPVKSGRFFFYFFFSALHTTHSSISKDQSQAGNLPPGFLRPSRPAAVLTCWGPRTVSWESEEEEEEEQQGDDSAQWEGDGG